MNITQQPAPVSLSMNLLPFVVKSSSQVAFRLKLGANTLLSQRYDPDTNGHIEVDVRDVVHAWLSFTVRPSATEPYKQEKQHAVFTAVFDSSYISFTVVKGGVDNLDDTCTDFLATHFLTWQPQTKRITKTQPEMLTYYAPGDCSVCMQCVYTNGKESDVETIENLNAGEMVTLPMGYCAVRESMGGDPREWTVWVESGSGRQLTYRQRYVLEEARSLNESFFLFENSLGGFDTLRAYGQTTLRGEYTHNLAKTNEVLQEYRVDAERRMQKHTGYLTRNEAMWLQDFFPSTRKYLYSGGSIRRIIVSDSSAEGNTDAGPVDYTFSYGYATVAPLPLLHLERTGQSKNPNISVDYPDTPDDAYQDDPDADFPVLPNPDDDKEDPDDNNNGSGGGNDEDGDYTDDPLA